MYSECNTSYGKKNRNKKRSNKLEKKVSKYRDKDGHIKKEMKECRLWITSLKNIDSLSKECYKVLVNKIPKYQKMDLSEIKFDIYHKLKHSINKNNYQLSKIYQENNFAIYKEEDICMFLLVLFEASKRKMLNSFLDIPDVFYILRQIKGVGLKYYI